MDRISEPDSPLMNDTPEPGSTRSIDGQTRIYYEGYWIKTYPVPDDTPFARKRLIEALTRRLFNHTEHGLNIPGFRLDEARHAWESEGDAGRKRVKGAMYAGALVNRATDIFTRLVDLQSTGVVIASNNDLMRECGRCLQEALSLTRLVLHRSGEEGIDELWGEPFRAFSIPLEDFYASRYLKIAQAMCGIDRIACAMLATFAPQSLFAGLAPIIGEFAAAARVKTETLRTDPGIFDVWANLVTAGERLASFTPHLDAASTETDRRKASAGTHLLCNGRDLIFYITRARVAMPKSTREFEERCTTYAATGHIEMMPIPLPA